jgi:hypothetical protein
MNQRTERSVKKNIANFFGSFGYLLCFLQWFWAIMLYFSVVQSVTLLVSSNASKPIEQPHGSFALPGSLEIIILAIITTIMVILTIYALIKMPMGIVKTSNKIVHNTAETMAPIVIKAQHKKDTKKIHAKITARLTLVIKSLLVIVPILLTAASGLLEKQSLDYSISLIIGCSLACLVIIFFTIQYTLASLLHVKMSDLW